MIEVTFLTPEPGFKKQLGSATFASVPLEKLDDFQSIPAGIISLESAKRIAEALDRDVVIGEIEGMEWRLDPPMR